MTALFSLAAPLRTDVDFNWGDPLTAGLIGYLAGHVVCEGVVRDTAMTPKSSAFFQVAATLALITLKKIITPNNLKSLIGEPKLKSKQLYIQGAFWLVSALAGYQVTKWLKFPLSPPSALLHAGVSVSIALVLVPVCAKESTHLRIN